jgi:hypothetical protein
MRTVYIETSIISYYAARPSRDLIALARQEITRDWWERGRTHWQLLISPVVIDEARRGDPVAAERRVAALAGMQVLEPLPAVSSLALRLKSALNLPDAKDLDAFHLAFAVHYRVECLLAWNFAHFANPTTERALADFVQSNGLWLPIMCTPEQLLEEDMS